MSYPLENCPEYEDLDPQTKAFSRTCLYTSGEKIFCTILSQGNEYRQIIVLHHKKEEGVNVAYVAAFLYSKYLFIPSHVTISPKIKSTSPKAPKIAFKASAIP